MMVQHNNIYIPKVDVFAEAGHIRPFLFYLFMYMHLLTNFVKANNKDWRDCVHTLARVRFCRYMCSLCDKYRNLIWAVTCDFQQCGILTGVDSDESVQPPFKGKNSRWCSVSSLFKQLTKALIRLRVCAGWPEALVVSNTTYHIVG